MSASSPYSQVINWLVLVVLSLVWGSSYILIKKSVDVFTPLQMGAWRMTIAGLCFLPPFLLRFRQINWKKGKWFLVVGLAGSGIPSVLFPLAQQYIDSSLAGILNSLTPLFTLVVGSVLFHARPGISQIAGIGMGLLGATMLILYGKGTTIDIRQLQYGLYIVLACALYGLSANTVGNFLKGEKSLYISAVAFSLLLPFSLGLVWFSGGVETLLKHPQGWQAGGYVFLLAFLSTVLASLGFFWLIQRTNAVFASSVSYLLPLVALGWGIWDGERIGWIQLVGMVCILSGVYLCRHKPHHT